MIFCRHTSIVLPTIVEGVTYPGELRKTGLRMAQKNDEENRRRANRRRVYKGAQITFDDAQRRCIVRNLSEGGAMLDVPSTATAPRIPHVIELAFDANMIRRLCHVVWREGERLGGQFS